MLREKRKCQGKHRKDANVRENANVKGKTQMLREKRKCGKTQMLWGKRKCYRKNANGKGKTQM